MSEKNGVFISYARKDGETFATGLLERLQHEEPELKVWMDRIGLEGGKDWRRQIIEAIDRAEYLVLVMTPGAMESENVRWEWLHARQKGVCVCPVLGVEETELDFENLPRWMRKIQFYDIEKHWKKFVHRLYSPCQIARVPFMAPDMPERFVERPHEFKKLLDLILDHDRQNPVAITTALYGAGGFGKTTLAAALCHDDDVINNFDDGILWATLGRETNILNELRKLYAALTGERPAFVDKEDAALALAEKMRNKDCLVVVDDVWDAAHLRPFIRTTKGCACLVTTRLFDIVSDYRCLGVDEMRLSEAAGMLVKQLDTSLDDSKRYEDLAERLGEWPLLIELAGSALRRRVARGDTREGALEYLEREFDKRGITAFDRKDATQRNHAVSRSVEISLGLLEPQERTRYTQLAIFPEDTDVPLAAAGDLWHLDDLDTEDLTQRLADLSLLKLNLANKTVRLHDVMREYIAGELKDPAATHAKLIDAWGNPHRLPHDYAWRWLAYHLSGAGQKAKLRELLLDFEWIKNKLAATDVTELVGDFDYITDDDTLRRVQETLRLASHVLFRDKNQLPGQLLGRIDPARELEIKATLLTGARKTPGTWLRPLTPSLTPAGGGEMRTLKGHSSVVSAVAVTPDGRRAISASSDQTLKVWDLETGNEMRTLKGHSVWVFAVAVTPDGRRAISASDDQTLKVWDLETGEVIATFDTGENLFCNAVTPNGETIITAGALGGLHFLHLEGA